MNDLGCITNAEVIQQFVSLEGKFVVDVGCGSMTFTRILADQGARILAVDPDPVQAEKNRAEPIDNIEFVETGADKLPLADQSVDGVFFSYSLHHVPAEIYPRVFNEVRRVLKPAGFIYVIEPIDCPLNQVMMLFHNEETVRAAAWQALEQLAAPHFESCRVVTYHGNTQYDSFEHFADHYSSRSFNSIYTEDDVRSPVVQEAFERLGEPDYKFLSPKRVMFLGGHVHEDRDDGT